MPVQWWYAQGGERKGPVDLEVLADRVALAEVMPHDLVWHEGLGTWQAVRDTKELLPHLPEVPPQIRKTAEPIEIKVANTPPGQPPQNDLPNRSEQGRELATSTLTDAPLGRRALARIIDLLQAAFSVAVLFIALSALARLAFDYRMKPEVLEWGPLVLPVIIAFLMVSLEIAWARDNNGASYGKLCAGIRMVSSSGEALSEEELSMRQIKMFFVGLGAGIPWVSLFAMAVTMMRLLLDKPALYEVDGSRVVVDGPINLGRLVGDILNLIIGAVLIALALWVLRKIF